MRGVLIAAAELAGAYELSPRVALRPEPFGALAYHFGNRRLSFLKVPELVDVVQALGSHPTLAGALAACGVAESRHASFAKAIGSLLESDMVVEREPAAAAAPATGQGGPT